MREYPPKRKKKKLSLVCGVRLKKNDQAPSQVKKSKKQTKRKMSEENTQAGDECATQAKKETPDGDEFLPREASGRRLRESPELTPLPINADCTCRNYQQCKEIASDSKRLHNSDTIGRLMDNNARYIKVLTAEITTAMRNRLPVCWTGLGCKKEAPWAMSREEVLQAMHRQRYREQQCQCDSGMPGGLTPVSLALHIRQRAALEGLLAERKWLINVRERLKTFNTWYIEMQTKELEDLTKELSIVQHGDLFGQSLQCKFGDSDGDNDIYPRSDGRFFNSPTPEKEETEDGETKESPLPKKPDE